MSYQYDLFISYRRNPETRIWINEHFKPLLALRVGLELDRPPIIYVDDQVESGTAWPAALGAALGSSRVLIVLWSGNYLASRWCARELSLMIERERETALRTVAQPHGLVIPAFIHDGDKFPGDLGYIQHFEIQKSFNVRMARNSPRAEELDAALTAEAPAIARSIRSAPEWRATWPTAAAQNFFDAFYEAVKPEQTTVPRFAP